MLSCAWAQAKDPAFLRVLIDRPPSSLNPRHAQDATGQRLNALIFWGLTRIDADLNAQPALASKWEILDGGKKWRFEMREGAKDHAGQTIDARRMVQCFEEYRVGKPATPLMSSFPNWKGTRVEGEAVVFELDKPDPYFARNASTLRYFRSEGEEAPCKEPRSGVALIGSGLYRPAKWEMAPEKQIDLLPVPELDTMLSSHSKEGRSPLRFIVARDETTRVLRLFKGDADVGPNVFSLSKTRWIEREHGDRFEILEREGVNVSYLAFNLKDPVLSKLEVRRAIALAIDREQVVKHKMQGLGTLAGSLVSPLLEESREQPYAFDPARAEKLLDQAGYPRGKEGVRLTLKYRTTPVLEGLETALIFQDMLRKIGVELVLDVVEPGVFLTSIRKGNFQLYSSRWVGVADGSILYRTLRTGNGANRVGYSDPGMDAWLDQAMGEPDLPKRKAVLEKVQRKMAEDLPYLPLWYWKNTTVVRKGVVGLKSSEISLSGGYEPLSRLRRDR